MKRSSIALNITRIVFRLSTLKHFLHLHICGKFNAIFTDSTIAECNFEILFYNEYSADLPI